MTANRPPARRAAALALLAALLGAAPAAAQWTRAEAVTSPYHYGVFARGDTVLAASDTVVWVSVNGGATWAASAPVGVVPASLESVWLRDGRIWAGSGGQGVFTSDDLGASWQPRSDGLAGGLFNSHNYILCFAERNDTLYAGTGGAGVFARPLRAPGIWQPTGPQLVAWQAGSVEAIASHGGRLVAVGGFNGMTFRNDGGAPWTESYLDDSGPLPDLGPTAAAWTGTAWLVATNHGVYRSAGGESPWVFTGLNFGQTVDSRMAAGDGRAFVVVNRSSGGVLRWTRDDGATWNVLETIPAWPSELALQGGRLWAARFDGLWYRDVSTLDAPPPAPRTGALAVRGAHPVRGGEAILGFGLVTGGEARLAVFDVAGRRMRETVLALPPGNHEVALDVRGLAPGMYLARLQAPGRDESLRFVRLD